MDNQEIWKDIPLFEGLYQISNYGNVKSLRFSKEKLLKLGTDLQGYKQCVLYKKDKRKNIKVHLLVAMAFLNHVPDGTHNIVVDHIDRNKQNNNVSNLRLVSHSFNTKNADFSINIPKSNVDGVIYNSRDNRWAANVYINRKRIFLGYYDLETEAINAVNVYKENPENFVKKERRNKAEITSKYKHLYYHKSVNKWQATPYKNGKQHYIGMFKTEEEANEAVIKFLNNETSN